MPRYHLIVQFSTFPKNGHTAWCDPRTFRTLVSHSDEGPKLETLVYESFTVANLPY